MQPPYPSSAAIEISIARVIASAKARGIAIRRVEYMAPSESWCKSLALIFFFESDDGLNGENQAETQDWFRAEFPEHLRSSASILPFSKMPEKITFEFDSHEAVVRDYQGNYFLRLR